jgi:hypothetical protein
MGDIVAPGVPKLGQADHGSDHRFYRATGSGLTAVATKFRSHRRVAKCPRRSQSSHAASADDMGRMRGGLHTPLADAARLHITLTGGDHDHTSAGFAKHTAEVGYSGCTHPSPLIRALWPDRPEPRLSPAATARLPRLAVGITWKLTLSGSASPTTTTSPSSRVVSCGTATRQHGLVSVAEVNDGINRSSLLTLWGAVVAERLRFDRAAALKSCGSDRRSR